MDAGRSRHAVHGRGRDPLRQSRPARLPHPLRPGVAWRGVCRLGGPRAEETRMIPAEMLTLRTVLADRRHSLLDRLASAAAGENLTGGQGIEPGFLRLLADTHTAIA